jgi:hypothetical protein
MQGRTEGATQSNPLQRLALYIKADSAALFCPFSTYCSLPVGVRYFYFTRIFFGNGEASIFFDTFRAWSSEPSRWLLLVPARVVLKKRAFAIAPTVASAAVAAIGGACSLGNSVNCLTTAIASLMIISGFRSGESGTTGDATPNARSIDLISTAQHYHSNGSVA